VVFICYLIIFYYIYNMKKIQEEQILRMHSILSNFGITYNQLIKNYSKIFIMKINLKEGGAKPPSN